jgi:hypothetical protein
MTSHVSVKLTGVAGSRLCLGMYGSILQLRKCNTRSFRQRWTLLREKGYKEVSKEEAQLNLERVFNASMVCEIGVYT